MFQFKNLFLYKYLEKNCYYVLGYHYYYYLVPCNKYLLKLLLFNFYEVNKNK